jgi:hypothetical protein
MCVGKQRKQEKKTKEKGKQNTSRVEHLKGASLG